MSNLLCVRGAGRAVTSLYADADVSLASPVSGIGIPLQIAVVDASQSFTPASGQSAPYYTPESMANWDIIAAVGNANLAPITGTFTLTFDAQTTSPLPWNATASQIATALNGLSTIASAGGVSVALASLVSTGAPIFVVTFSSVGARDTISANPANLAPLTVIPIGHLVTGTSTLADIQSIAVVQNPGSCIELTSSSLTTGPGATVSVLQVGGGGKNHKIRIYLSPTVPLPDGYPGPYGGQWSVTIGAIESDPIFWNASADDLEAAITGLSTVGGGNASVNQEATGQYLVIFQAGKANTNMGTITADGSALLVVQYFAGTLRLDTPGIQLLLGSAASVSTFFQIVGSLNSGPREQLYGPVACTLTASVITPGSLTPQPVIEFYTSAQCDAKFALLTDTEGLDSAVFVNPTIITGYTGGAAGDLDATVTVGVTVPRLFGFVHTSDGLKWYLLRGGTDAANSPLIIHPSDYNASTNAKVFVQVA